MDNRYKVIFSNLLKEEGYFKGQMLMLGVSEDISNEIIKKAPVILKQDLSLKDARKYADAVYQAGGRVTIQVEKKREEAYEKVTLSCMATLKNFTMCPQCGYKQLNTGTCVKCGFLFEGIVC
jgi:hypothetical protein